jgi:hypothetical protein
VAVSTEARRLARGDAISFESTRRIEAATSVASIAEPSWNLTPERSLNV